MTRLEELEEKVSELTDRLDKADQAISRLVARLRGYESHDHRTREGYYTTGPSVIL